MPYAKCRSRHLQDYQDREDNQNLPSRQRLRQALLKIMNESGGSSIHLNS